MKGKRGGEINEEIEKYRNRQIDKYRERDRKI